MKKFFPLMLASLSAEAVIIPLGQFDQAKLENLLRLIPKALVKNEKHPGFMRKHYLFPKGKNDPFQIKCHANHYNSSPIPSEKYCELNLQASKLTLKGDEYQLLFKDPKSAKGFYEAINYGEKTRKLYATDRVYGQALDGKYRELFRYVFACSTESCEMTFTAKEEK